MIGAARALSAAALPFDRPDYLYADCCGTGGDGSGLINVSTATAFVAAGAGLPIAKHGNRSVSSRCGSADVLEAVGAKIDIAPEKARALLDETGFCFLFAPAYHPGMKHAAPVRRQLGVRTIMNLLGPCINPARPPVQPRRCRSQDASAIAQTLAAMGVEQALVVHGSGLDEIALHGETRALRLSGGEIEELEITPEDAGIERAPLKVVTGGEVDENAERLKALLAGRASRPEEDIVVLNTAALLMTAGEQRLYPKAQHRRARRWRPVVRPSLGAVYRVESCLTPPAFWGKSPLQSARSLRFALTACRSMYCASAPSQPSAALAKCWRSPGPVHPRNQEGLAIRRGDLCDRESG